MEKFLRQTADYTLRECYKRFGDMNLAEKAFVEVYAAFSKNPLSCLISFRILILNYEIYMVCKYITEMRFYDNG